LHVDLGAALEKLSRAPEAIEQYQQALKLNPDMAAARDTIERLRAVP
jgi:tetratricopeptide (TPR) repeat protein